MRSWIHHVRGKVLRQAHVNLEGLDGLKEDMLSRHGFVGRVAELYRRNEPINWTRIEGPMKPWDLDGYQLVPTDHKDAHGGPLRLFYNSDCAAWISRRKEPMPYCARNADGDECWFCHEGEGVFETEFGNIPYEPGDYVVIPKGITYRIIPNDETSYFFIVESVGEIDFADIGPIGRHAPFDPSLLFVPEPTNDLKGKPTNDDGEWEVRIKFRGEYSSVFYPFDPLDVEGWKGDLFPFKLNIRDYRPISSERIHLMPSAHGIFKGPGFLICNFLPRPAEGAREVERVPPFHRNIDYDEVMFAHGGRVLNSELSPASITLLPQGLHHGLPDSFTQLARSTWKRDDYYDQKLIALDTEKPLIVCEEVKFAARLMDQIRGAKMAEEVG